MDAPRPHFTLFGFPVRVQASFLIIAVLLGAGAGGSSWSITDLTWMALVMGIVFVSILAHELGHAFAGRAFGLQPGIILGGLGGLTYWRGGKDVGHGRSFLISVAGPAVGIFFGIFLLIASALHPLPGMAGRLVQELVWVNLGWGVLNLLPVMPLDGGNALRSILGITGLGDPELGARGVSILLGGLLTIGGALMHSLWMAAILGMFTFQNVQALRARLRTREDEIWRKRLDEGYPQWLATKNASEMIREGSRARTQARTPQLQAHATEVVAMGQCLDGDPRSALATLQTMPQGYLPGVEIAVHVLLEAGERAAAIDYLERVASHTGDPAATRKLAELRAGA